MNREPKYMSVVHWVEEEIRSGDLRLGDRLPSANAFRIKFSLSRSSVFLAMKDLCARGIVHPQEAVGYFVKSTYIDVQEKVLLLFNELTSFKEDLYRSFLDELGPDVPVDIVFHHYDRRVFENQLREADGNYTSYVVMPGKFRGLRPLLESLHGKVFLVDHYQDDLRGHFPAVGQDFEQDTYDALVQGLPHLRKYSSIVLLQHHAIEPEERCDGLRRFCGEYGFSSLALPSIQSMSLVPGTLYLTAEDRELVRLIKQARQQNLGIGTGIGILSYNESLLKEVIANGISTLSTDFTQMGRTLAGLIRRQTPGPVPDIRNPWILRLRGSI